MLNKYLNRLGAYTSASIGVGLFASAEAHAAGGTEGFNKIGKNISAGIDTLPGLATSLAYIFGIILAILGILKVKDHVENPSNTPLKDGAIRLAAGGALFAVPAITLAMQELISKEGTNITAQQVQGVNKFYGVK